MDFKDFGLDERIINALKKEKVVEPNKVQCEVFEKFQQGKDIMVRSQTGSGKTLAYLLPMLKMLEPLEKGSKFLILVPTHELAMQVQKQVNSIAKNSGIDFNIAAIVGNVNITRQIDKLKEKPQIIVGTTGRIFELIKKKKIQAHLIKTIVIDEADRMLDKDNINGVKDVIKCCMRDVQIAMFSASMPSKTVEIGKSISKNPEFIEIEDTNKIPEKIKHMHFVVEKRDKLEMLRKLANSMKPQKAMVFVNKVADIEELTEKLKYHHYKAECIHGSNIKNDRKKAIDDFKNGKIQYLIATDIAARGLHFEGVDAVFHISIPEEPMDYLHRAGRCGRGDNQGVSVLIVTESELELVKKYRKEFGINIVPKRVYEGKIVSASEKMGKDITKKGDFKKKNSNPKKINSEKNRVEKRNKKDSEKVNKVRKKK